jgi:Asp-tRNA(Asn)/Glu-tRNA(Gln) amidotransferase A subunit family amidase
MVAALAEAEQAVRTEGAADAGPPPDWLGEARRITEAYWGRRRRTGEQVDHDLDDWDLFRSRVLADMSDVDAVITPTVQDVAPAHREMSVDDYVFCLPASLTGAPAITVPVGDGAVQVVAHRWRDDVAVAVARVVEAGASRVSARRVGR